VGEREHDPAEGLKGRLLVASPALLDPNFARTVVFLLEHTAEDGAVGLVLNRPSDVAVVEALPEWGPFAADPSVVYVGGPVSEGSAICLGRARGEADIEVIDLSRHPDDQAPERVRLFAGYAGWGTGQLEQEIEERAWFVLGAADDDALSDDPEGLWERVLRRQPGRVRIFATYPPALSLN
jgi:putative transcriptional regulator